MTPTHLAGPADPDVPLLVDSPHSGADYPPDMNARVERVRLRHAEDYAVDALFGAVPDLGLPLFKALFPRIYVDVNRAREDVDPASVAGALPFAPAPSPKAALGKGVIWTMAPPPPEPTPIYDAPLSAQQVMDRLTGFWSTYRDGLAQHLDRIHARHGVVYYLDAHSMQAVSSVMHEEGPGKARAEIVLSDRDGTTCAPAFTTAAAGALEGAGFKVAINTPYKGADLVRTHGRPAENRHALQIEVRRDLYMDEAMLTKTDRFQDTASRLGTALKTLREAVRTGTLG
ncbi:MAG: N-formylglutamate amidohydrolase [Devosia sp.]